ncbi:hypothetical protein BA196_15250 [Klebsiella pneumoniae]|nr:hypothetical protein BA196_15250 [Klebsiella pneumoniae]
MQVHLIILLIVLLVTRSMIVLLLVCHPMIQQLRCKFIRTCHLNLIVHNPVNMIHHNVKL